MTDVRVSYALPTTRVDGSPVVVDHVRIEKRLEGIAEWTMIDEVAADKQFSVDSNVPGGLWHYRGIVVPTEGPESDPVEASVNVPVVFAKASPLVSIAAVLV